MVTGASAGVGRATAREFGRRGYRVALLARGTDGLHAAESEIASDGSMALAITTDVSDPAQVEEAAERTEAELGPIEAWVNDAMATIFSPFWEVEPDEYRRSTEVTYLGAVWGTRAALRRMRTRNRGVIVQVGSALAYRGIPLQSAYCGAKHAIKGFTESVRCELLHEQSGVKIAMVQLPALNTPQFEVGRTRLPRHPQPVPPIYQPEVAARAIVWSAEHPRRELYVGAPTWKTIWGNKVAPGFADRFLARNGFDSQQTDERIDPRARRDNLFEPVPGDHGAHGRFDSQSRRHSPLTWAARHRALLAPVAGAALIGAAAARLMGD